MTLTAYEQGLLAFQRQEYTTARAHLESAPDDPAALLLLAQAAGAGLGEPVDTDRKLSLYERAADRGSAEAAYNLGAVHGGEQRYEAALRWYRRAAELGDTGALRMAGVMHATGQGVATDDAEAERLLLAAAAQGDPQAAFDLGILYGHQRHDPVSAMQWFLTAAKENDPRARREVALLVPPLKDLSPGNPRAGTLCGVALAFFLDEPQAGVVLLEAAAEAGEPEARRALAFLVRETDPARSAQLNRLAAEAGDGYAAHNLGVGASDPHEAVSWLRRAAEAGVTDSYPHLANRLSELDIDEEALRWYVRAAEAGHQGCMFAAACWYRDGFGGPVDLVQALRWYLVMLDAGNGDGLHEAHQIVPSMTDDEIHEAGRQAGRILDAHIFVVRRGQPQAS